MLRRAVCGAAIAVFLAPATAQADWKSAPVVPRLDPPTAKATLATLHRGVKLGNRRDVLAKVGDSITWSPAFLQPLGCGQSKLGHHRGLRSVIRLFSKRRLAGQGLECKKVNSLSRVSAAAKPLKASSWPIQPGDTADSGCAPAETPLACEIRLDRPAYAVILLGTNDITFGYVLGGDVIPGFLANIRTIVQETRRLGVVPILNTLPPRTDTPTEATTEQLNASLVPLARSLRVPVINLWRALAPLPNQGLSDGVHLSVSGWPGCPSPCDPNLCAPNCFSANFTPAGLEYGTDTRNLITLQTLRRLSALAPPRSR